MFRTDDPWEKFFIASNPLYWITLIVVFVWAMLELLCEWIDDRIYLRNWWYYHFQLESDINEQCLNLEEDTQEALEERIFVIETMISWAKNQATFTNNWYHSYYRKKILERLERALRETRHRYEMNKSYDETCQEEQDDSFNPLNHENMK